MANRQHASVLRGLNALVTAGTAAGQTDGQLLERFLVKRAESAGSAAAAEAAFAALVDRHGAMVWGVCRRVLRDAHEAEDAFQATFLVLVRKAGTVRVDGSVGRWLYGVAHRVARRIQSEAARRETYHGRVAAEASDDPAEAAERRDLGAALGEEVDGLPLKYRAPVELCYLQGMTYDQAARQLGWPVATVKSRLARGRLRLRERLGRRGLGAVAAAVATVAAESRAAVPPKLVGFTVRAAAGAASGVSPARVVDITEGVLTMMAWEKLRVVAAGVLIAVGLAAGALARQASEDRPPAPRPARGAAEAKGVRDERWVKSLPNGATIEVVGVSTYPAGPDTWWRPDGTPLDRPPCDGSTARLATDQDDVARTVVVRITGLPNGADHSWWIDQARGGAQGSARRGGEVVPDLDELATLFPRGLDACTVRFEVAAGPWRTVQTWGTSPGSRGARGGPSFIFGAPVATAKGTVLSVTHDIDDRSSVRLVAVDADGGEHPAGVRSGGGVKAFHQLVGEFDLPPERIKELRVQTRPFEAVDVPGVALKPSKR